MRQILAFGIACLLAITLIHSPARADLRTPAWWDPDGVGVGQDWHYRIAISVSVVSPASVGHVFDIPVQFNNYMNQLRIAGTFDINSIRVVRADGTLVAVQEYDDGDLFGNIDPLGNNRGQVRWISELDGSGVQYYIYFDILENGAKSPNPQQPINAGFETGSPGQFQPAGWQVLRASTNFDAQIRPNETLSITSDGQPATPGGNVHGVDGSPFRSRQSYLIGARTNNEIATPQIPSPINGHVAIRRTIRVPATNPGNLVFYFKPQGWHSGHPNFQLFDFISADINGDIILGPGQASTYYNRPFSPNYASNAPADTLTNNSQPGSGQFNGFDTDLNRIHRVGGNSLIDNGAQPWIQVVAPLSAYAGQFVTLTIRSTHTPPYKSWFLIDNFQWSRITSTGQAAEAFGTILLAPANNAAFIPGTAVSVRAQLDARPRTGADAVSANIYDRDGNFLRTANLFNDGTHGDQIAGDAIWTNDGNTNDGSALVVPPLPIVTAGARPSIRLFARDTSTNVDNSANNGLISRTGSANVPLTEGSYWNIDQVNFTILTAIVNVQTIQRTLTNPVSGSGPNPKSIPGARISYCIFVQNTGNINATNLTISSMVPPDSRYIPGSIRSAATSTASCGPSTIEDDDNVGADETDPLGASVIGNNFVGIIPSLAPNNLIGSSFSYDVLID